MELCKIRTQNYTLHEKHSKYDGFESNFFYLNLLSRLDIFILGFVDINPKFAWHSPQRTYTRLMLATECLQFGHFSSTVLRIVGRFSFVCFFVFSKQTRLEKYFSTLK